MSEKSNRTPSRATLRATLRGNYHEANFGDDALLIASLLLLQNSQIDCSLETSAAYHDTHTTDLREAHSDLTDSDLIVYGGGTQFFHFEFQEKPSRWLGFDWLERPRKIARKLLGKRQANPKPVIGIGLGVGPFIDAPRDEKSTARLLESMDFLWVRDPGSAAFCERHGIPHITSTDLCFTPPFIEALDARRPSPARKTTAGPIIGLVIRDWPALPDDFYRKYIGVSKRLQEAGYATRFFIFSPADRRCIDELTAAGEDLVAWHPGFGTLESFLQLFNDCDLVVTARFHGAIFAVLGETPYLPIKIEPKLEHLNSVFDPGEQLHISPTDNAGTTLQKIIDAAADLPRLRLEVRHARSQQIASAQQGFMQLQQYLAKWNHR